MNTDNGSLPPYNLLSGIVNAIAKSKDESERLCCEITDNQREVWKMPL